MERVVGLTTDEYNIVMLKRKQCELIFLNDTKLVSLLMLLGILKIMVGVIVLFTGLLKYSPEDALRFLSSITMLWVENRERNRLKKSGKHYG